MSLLTIWTAATDADFQSRCWAALYDVANKVANGDEGYPAAGQASVQPVDDTAFATKVLRRQIGLAPETLAWQVLRNSSISASVEVSPAGAVDSDILWQINNGCWADLRNIG